ncbi:helicase-related protein [Flavobacterium sp. 140616W15]|uniref:helicase-related protein n=1 Tax=Flavobacterium sp. 140616W15 TaxID=2478552 RepID=UPI000F0D0F53|nr:helicase-related protein [Flavobacterium sp. 140616W15]AYN03599.1 hypothetical protein EAG11_05010 [Flavobacterium sp. 140616W15]
MSNFKKKRESLEIFVKEQIIGPGAFNKRYFFIDKWDKNEFSGVDFKSSPVNAIDNKSEVLTEVPAYQYSSAILFPETRVPKETTIEKDESMLDNPEANEPDLEDFNAGADDDNIKDDSAESLVSKQQNYPNSFGLSFVIDENFDIQNDLKVGISFRKYINISKNECCNRKLSCLVTEYENEIETAVALYFSPLFAAVRKSGNLFILAHQEISKNNIYDIDYIHLNNYLKNGLLKTIKNIFGESLVVLNKKKDVTYYGIKNDYDLQFYSVTDFIAYSGNEYENVASLFDNTLVSFLKTELKSDTANYSKYKKLINELEIYNQLRSYVTDLKSVYKPKNASPVWECTSYDNIDVVLPGFEGNSNIYRSRELAVNKDIKEITDLKYCVQYVRKDGEIFIKIILLNKAIVILKENEPPQLNKKNEANAKAFFGVKLRAEEKNENVLKQYNPPHLLDFDEEDNFNKLIYRNYHDFGEGYNTSVNWGKTDDDLRYICTEFLPEQETPNVDFKPSRIDQNGSVVSRLQNDAILSMRNLSTLSETKDNEILDGLNDFIDEYKAWIDEKKNELSQDNSLKIDQIELLSKQMLSCENDVKRLKRNISLLKSDSKAMAAFRTMNTALFMQLHHSILKKEKNIDLSHQITEEYYKDSEKFDDNGNKIEYKWRSFQIAFILLNVDAFVQPDAADKTVEKVFSEGWPERNEIADLVWFPTGGGKTEAYLGIIAFAIAYRRFTKESKSGGTTVLMRYTLRLLTLQQFQRATMLICALEVIRKDNFNIPHSCSLGDERITIGLFVGSGSLPNQWKGVGNSNDSSMIQELAKISSALESGNIISTSLPFTDCPWCGTSLFFNKELSNVSHKAGGENYGMNDQLSICCNNSSCTYKGYGRNRPTNDYSLPFRLFDEDIYKFPPTLLFGTVDKFAALANKVSSNHSERNNDSRRLFGGHSNAALPPELIIQDELHLLLGPLGSAVGLFEKSIDYLCTYQHNGLKVKPKIVTSTATTRNTDKQIFALFNRRSEIFPKQGILADDSFFAYYERDKIKVDHYVANRKYVGILPVGKTQVWMQLRIASICLTHRLKYIKECYTNDIIFENPSALNEYRDVFDFYHTVLSYFNSLKDVGKTQSQLNHYLPGDINFITKNTIPWSIIDKLLRSETTVDYSELTGRLSGEQVKSNLSNIEKKWTLISNDVDKHILNSNTPPAYVISTNMISVGIDVSRFNTMIISSMPRNIAEYIQASSRVARSKEGIVFTVHHPFRSRDISHYQRFKEFHEKFYSYVEPISVTPFASKALERYLAMFVSVIVRHTNQLELTNNADAGAIDEKKTQQIKKIIGDEINEIANNASKLDSYLQTRKAGVKSSVDGIISDEELMDLNNKLSKLLDYWIDRLQFIDSLSGLEYRAKTKLNSLFISSSDNDFPSHWKVGYSLREIDSSVVIKTVQQ